MPKKLKHDRYLEELCEKIRDDYDNLTTNVDLYSKNKRRKIAEVDILAIKGKSLHAYEVKCSYRKTKAKKQLKRIKRLLPKVGHLFFFCGEAGSIEEIICP